MNYPDLLTCFRSEQMTAAQLLAHMAEDAGFADYVRENVA
jgi:hypothetical protein